MDRTTFRILEAMAANIGGNISINGLREWIAGRHGKAYYKNIYDRIMEMAGSGEIALEKAGNSSLLFLNFGNGGLISLLAQFELEKKLTAAGNPELSMLIQALEARVREGFRDISSVSAVRPEKNMRLNRAELLFIMREAGGAGAGTGTVGSEAAGIQKAMGNLAKSGGMRIDCLIIAEDDFTGLITAAESNPLREMIAESTAIMYQENYWSSVAKAAARGIRPPEADENPSEISGQDVVYNLARFGYKEMGAKVRKGKDICIETMAVSLLLKGDERRIEAIPTILAKSGLSGRKPVYPLLAFLSAKYGVSGRMLAILEFLYGASPDFGISSAIDMLRSAGARKARFDGASAREKMELYHGH